jgi:hypothetical protein
MKSSASAVLFVAACLTAVTFPAATRAQKPDSGFATHDEVTLLVTQTKRAVTDYTDAVALEGELAKDPEEIENDKKLIDGLNLYTKALSTDPNKFNRVEALPFVLMLDDASRDASLCFGSAMQSGMKALAAHDSELAENYLALANKCTAASSSLYTVSENAAALYQKFLNAFDDLAHKAVDEMDRCTDVLKKNPPKQ